MEETIYEKNKSLRSQMMINDKKAVIIYTDGACQPNPGVGGYGIVLMYKNTRKEVSGGFRFTTNNRMEIYAVIKGLEILKEACKVTLYSDSQYVVRAMTEGWAVRWKKNDWWRNKDERAVNIDLWEKLLQLCEKHEVSFQWIKGHAGHAENERCDKLAYAALQQTDLPLDESYENVINLQKTSN